MYLAVDQFCCLQKTIESLSELSPSKRLVFHFDVLRHYIGHNHFNAHNATLVFRVNETQLSKPLNNRKQNINMNALCVRESNL
jgi:hypothetical protein